MAAHALGATIGRWDREIVAKRVAILTGLPAVLSDLVALLTLFGVHVPVGLPAKVTGVVAATLTLLGAAGSILWARAGTTPADPRLGPVSSNGVALVEQAVTAAASAAVAKAPQPSDPGLSPELQAAFAEADQALSGQTATGTPTA